MALQDDQTEKIPSSDTAEDEMPEYVPPPEDMLKRLIDKLSDEGKLAGAESVEYDESQKLEISDMEDNTAEPEQHPVVLAKAPLPSELEEVLPVRRPEKTPWTLQQFFDGEIDLDVELAKRFPSMPIMSKIDFRTLGAGSGRRVALLSTQDGGATLTVDADQNTKVIQLSFTFGSMLTLRFVLDHLNDVDRTRWLELMRRDEGGLAFLWGPSRWQEEYLVCISRRSFTSMYAFSPNNFEAAARLTPTVTRKYLDWLDEIWQAEADEDDDSPLLTW